MEEYNIFYLIMDNKTGQCLYGKDGVTMKFSSEIIANEIADQFFRQEEEYIVFTIKI